jgi:superfamily II DNA or RNA helicase
MEAAVEEDQRESERVLTGLARGRFGHIAPQRVARHILAATPEADWAVRRAALDALSRRHGFAQRDALRVVQRPAGSILGTYRTGGPGRGPREMRPYETALLSVEPLRTSCSCVDFVRSSLGLCKHGLTVLDALEKAGKLTRAPSEAGATVAKARLSWSSEHPLRGDGARLARLRYMHAGRSQPPPGFASGEVRAKVLRDAGGIHDFVIDLERRIARGAVQTEPAVLTLLAEEKARAARRLALGDTREPMKHLGTLGRKLYPYQREGVKRFFETGRLLLADDMGLGKTTQAIAACHGLFETGRVRRGLLIVPASLKPQWKREWEATTSVPITLVEGSPEERARLYARTKSGFLTIGYEQLLRDIEHVRRYAPEMVVLDEAQRIKNWATKSAAYVKALEPAYRLVLTGTPMENRFDELASIMDFVDDLALEPKWRLVPFHQVQAGDGGKGVGGARNLNVLRERLSDSMLRRIRKDVLSQLPARTDTRVPVEMTDAQREPHDELRQPIAELVSIAERRPLRQVEFLRLMSLLTTQRILCNGLAQLHFESTWPRCLATKATPEMLEGLFAPKLGVLRALLEQVVVAQGRKVVVFSQWRAMLRLSEWAVRDLLAAAGLRAVFFTGGESSKLRERAIVDLHDDPAVAVMFLSDAGGVGLNLQRAASACINLELPWNPAVLEQRIGRIYRLGQKLPIDVYNLVTEDGIESRIAKLLGQKKAVFSALFDGPSDQVLFDGQASFLEGVKKLVEPVPVPLAAPLEESPDAAEPSSPGESPEPSAEASAEIPSGEPSGAGLRVARLADGGLRIDAPPELAGALASLLESLAQSLRAQDKLTSSAGAEAAQ